MSKSQSDGFQERLERVAELVRRLEATADPALRASATELMQSVMDLHGAGLERMLEIAAEAGENGEAIIHRFGSDSLVSNLLVLHGMHPEDLQTRVGRALEKVRPMLRKRDAKVDLVKIEGERVHLRIHAEGHGCGSNADGLKTMVQDAIYEAAPDVAEVLVEPAPNKANFVSLQSLVGVQETVR